MRMGVVPGCGYESGTRKKVRPRKRLSASEPHSDRKFQNKANLIREHCHSPLSAYENRQLAAPTSYGRVEVNRRISIRKWPSGCWIPTGWGNLELSPVPQK